MLELRLNKLINEEILSSCEKKVAQINEMIMNKSGAGNDFLGWVDWPVTRPARATPSARSSWPATSRPA